MQPTEIPADIPINQHIECLSLALQQDDPAVEVYIVGGAVRDHLWRQFHNLPVGKPKDVDLTTNLSEEEILQRLRSPFAVKHGIRVKEKESVDTFGVVFANISGHGIPPQTYEVAPFRKDVGIADGRHPDRIERGTIYDDAMRRDLTMNNLFYDFNRRIVLDFNENGQGLSDIRNGIARPVGDPFQRFEEDKLRILRLVRFFSRFNSGKILDHLDSRTLDAIREYGNLRQQGISAERIFMECLAGLKQSLFTASFFMNLEDLGLMGEVFPEMEVDKEGIGRLRNHKNPKVVMAWLLRKNKNVAARLNELKYPNFIGEGVQFLIDAMAFKPDDAFAIVRKRDKRLIENPLSDEAIRKFNQEILDATQSDLSGLSKIVEEPLVALRLEHLRSYQPPDVDGFELAMRGLKGPEIGAEQRRIVAEHYRVSFEEFLTH